jgi:hypothetical protein
LFAIREASECYEIKNYSEAITKYSQLIGMNKKKMQLFLAEEVNVIQN